MPTLAYQVVDVFTDRTFTGNPLAVVLDADDLPTEALQALASEFNLSETAFPMLPTADGADYRLRIFTPSTELPFAGHPSVGAAWVLATLGRIESGRVVQECGAGLLPLEVAPDRGPVALTGGEATAVPCTADVDGLLAAVGLTTGDLAGYDLLTCGTGLPWTYLSVSRDAVARARPDLGALLRSAGDVSVSHWDAATATAYSRVFAAEAGVLEDPATGSAALGYGVWLVANGLVPGDGETAYTVLQGVDMGRPSRLECVVTARGGQAVEVQVRGSVVSVARGEIVRPGVPR